MGIELLIRNRDLEDEEGQIERLVEFEATLRLNDVSSWSITMREQDAAGLLFDFGKGIMLYRDKELLLSGPMTSFRYHDSADGRRILLTGADDTAYLNRPICYPVIGGLSRDAWDGNYYFSRHKWDGASSHVVDETYKGYDIRTGRAETVLKELVCFNCGPRAPDDRRQPNEEHVMQIAPDRGLGNIVTSNARGERLLEQCQDLAISGVVNFSVTQTPYTPELIFDVWEGRDLTTGPEQVVFSRENGTIKELDYEVGEPKGNYVIAAGSGALVDQKMYPSQDDTSIALYGRYEMWVSGSSGASSDDIPTQNAAMEAQSQAALVESAYDSKLTLQLTETDQVRWRRDFNLGDKTRTFVRPGLFVDEIVRELYYNISAESRGGASGSMTTKFKTKQLPLALEIAKKHDKAIRELRITK